MGRDFDASDDLIDVGLPLGATSSGTKTFLVWLYPHADATMYIITNYDADGPGGFSLLFNSGRTLGIAWTASANTVQTTDVLTLNVWTHLAAVFDTGTTGGKIYINKALSKEGNLGTEQTETNKIRLSGRWITADSGSAILYDGLMAEALLYNAALTASEIAAAYAGNPPRDSRLKGHWPLWGVATPEPDLSGNLKNGTVTGATLSNHAPVGRYAPYLHRLPMRIFTLAGVTRNGLTGAIVGGCTVQRFRTSDNAFIDQVTSDVNGIYSFSLLDPSTTYFIRAFKDGSNVFGTTDDDLVGA